MIAWSWLVRLVITISGLSQFSNWRKHHLNNYRRNLTDTLRSMLGHLPEGTLSIFKLSEQCIHVWRKKTDIRFKCAQNMHNHLISWFSICWFVSAFSCFTLSPNTWFKPTTEKNDERNGLKMCRFIVIVVVPCYSNVLYCEKHTAPVVVRAWS